MSIELVGHRGLALNHIENTIGSFEDAFNKGANAIELDIQLTSDKVPIVYHDFDLKRLLRMDGKVSDFPLGELRKLDLGNSDKIPTLDEVIYKFTDKKIYVELKTIDDDGKRYNRELPEIIFERYKKIPENIVFISFDPESLIEMRRKFEKVVLGLDYEKNSEKWIELNEIEEFLLKNRIEYLIPSVEILGDFMNLDGKIKILPWVVNDLKVVEKFFKNIYGVISDRCDLIYKQLKNYNL